MAGSPEVHCCVCKTQFWLPTALYEAACAGRETISFYRPYGHKQWFAKTPPHLEPVRREGNVVTLEKKS